MINPKDQVKISCTENQLVDEIWDLTIKALKPNQTIKIRTTMQDLWQNLWTSYAIFKATAKGEVSVLQAPLKSSYGQEAHPMGLIWSMQCKNVHGLRSRRFNLTDQTIKIEVFAENNCIAQKLIHRKLVADHVQKLELDYAKDKLVGNLFVSKNRAKQKLPVVIVLAGSSGGQYIEQAALLASNGIPALALEYFNHQTEYHNHPKEIKNIPLEYFYRGIKWLQKQNGIDKTKIAVMGTSRGGELALLLGATFNEIKTVISYVPNHAIQAAFGPSDHLTNETEPSWTLNGKPLSCFPLIVKNVNWFDGKPVILKDGFLTLSEEEKNHTQNLIDHKAIIEVEKINGPVVLISAGDDQMWPSKKMSELIFKRLQRKKFKFLASSQHLMYPHAGHLIMHPWWPTTGEHAVHPVDNVDYAFGGTAKADALAGYESWLLIKKHLHEVFAMDSAIQFA